MLTISVAHYSYSDMVYNKAGNLTEFVYDDSNGGPVPKINTFDDDLLAARGTQLKDSESETYDPVEDNNPINEMYEWLTEFN